MASENDDVTKVLQALLNEIQPFREQLEMMVDEARSDNEEFNKAQLQAIKKRKHSIDNIFSQIDSIMEAHSGGKRKTKRRRNKKKHKTKKKRRRRRKK